MQIKWRPVRHKMSYARPIDLERLNVSDKVDGPTCVEEARDSRMDEGGLRQRMAIIGLSGSSTPTAITHAAAKEIVDKLCRALCGITSC